MNDKVILDVGCGKYKHDGAIGLDINPKHNADITDDATNIKRYFNNKSVDLVYCFSSLEHMKQPYDVLLIINDVLKDDGELIIIIPNKYHILSMLKWVKDGKNNVDWSHIYAWTLPEILNILESCAFTKFKITYITNKHYHKKNILCMFLSIFNKRISEYDIMIECKKYIGER